MSFQVNSTSHETAAVKQIVRVLGRSSADDVIAYAGCFVCKLIAGSNPPSYSQHSWGNGLDVFPRNPGNVQAELDEIFHTAIRNATQRTLANRGRKMPAAEIIHHDGRLIWTPSQGIHPYTGTTGAHIHISGAPLRTGVPSWC